MLVMKHRVLVHSLNHTFLVVDITSIGLPTEIYPQDGQQRDVPTLRFQHWNHVEQCFLRMGADAATVGKTSAEIKKRNIAVLTIV